MPLCRRASEIAAGSWRRVSCRVYPVRGSPNDQQSNLLYWDVPLSEIEAIAEELVALVEEFDAGISEGYVSPEFAQRVNQLRQTAERLFG